MTNFSPTFIKFFKDLSKNNTGDWFNENRKTYEDEVKKPFASFVEDMIARIRKHEPDVKIKTADAIMRINKDIRFSKDKTPYNTHVAANISKFGKKDKAYPGFYFQLSADHVKIFGGAYMVEPPTLQKIRTYISKNQKEFAALYKDKDFKDKYGSLQGEQSKRLPPEFVDEAKKEPLIANKQFFYSAELKSSLITSDKLADTLMEYYKAGKKMNEFLQKAMK
jgi:uncharacterized protein (TIGR02453 family)